MRYPYLFMDIICVILIAVSVILAVLYEASLFGWGLTLSMSFLAIYIIYYRRKTRGE